VAKIGSRNRFGIGWSALVKAGRLAGCPAFRITQPTSDWLRYLKPTLSAPGRLGWLPTRGSHRSVLAQLRHTVRHPRDLSALVAVTRSQGTTPLPCFPPADPWTLSPSLHRVPTRTRVPLLQRYYGTLRLPVAFPPRFVSFAWRYHPARSVIRSFRKGTRRLKALPGSWGTRLHLRPVLGPRQDLRTRPYGASAWPPLSERRRLSGLRHLSGLDRTASVLAVYASSGWLPS